MKIIITGGAGFIGTKLSKKLLEKNDVVVFDNFLEQIHGTKNVLKIDKVKYIVGDVTKKEDWELVFLENPDLIIHLAAETGTGQSMDEIIRYTNTNILGTSILLEFLKKKKHNVKKLILSSTRAIYGNEKNSTINNKNEPKSIYGVTKLTQEKLIITSCEIPYTILRYQNVYGEGQSLNNPYTGIISIFSKLMSENKLVTIYDDGKPKRDFIYVDDVVEITEECVYNQKTNNQIYDIGTGKSYKILTIAKKLRLLLKSKSKIQISNYHREGDVLYAKGDIRKIKEQTNWYPKTSLSNGLKSFVDWFKTNNK